MGVNVGGIGLGVMVGSKVEVAVGKSVLVEAGVKVKGSTVGICLVSVD
jgi:hypothetical protein